MWDYLGDLETLSGVISRVTSINEDALTKERLIESFSIAQRMSWAAGRKTTRLEDRAYSLLGIFGVSLSIIYGEGTRAFVQLQDEILRETTDQTIFAFGRSSPYLEDSQVRMENLLAASPDEFAACHNLEVTPWLSHNRFEVSGQYVTFMHQQFDPAYGVALSCCDHDRPEVTLFLRLQGTEGLRDTWLARGPLRLYTRPIQRAGSPKTTAAVRVRRTVEYASRTYFKSGCTLHCETRSFSGLQLRCMGSLVPDGRHVVLENEPRLGYIQHTLKDPDAKQAVMELICETMPDTKVRLEVTIRPRVTIKIAGQDGKLPPMSSFLAGRRAEANDCAWIVLDGRVLIVKAYYNAKLHPDRSDLYALRFSYLSYPRAMLELVIAFCSRVIIWLLIGNPLRTRSSGLTCVSY
ncbi:hypothetical protein LTR78_001096 [Recurvomyces mirabilis]|uniref:DUF8212 domain-containing protein n=1 Tax=Recurvomyces mirabilis TaxID=574656 RepID=A0AAE0WWD6_9PEZI|nr:hypothetical protein LTR78_001096 [Recurvomyces mirabilis]KAK5159068.1 hypothetical protein LTS14_003176 [Recurvomyces mirabilis]